MIGGGTKDREGQAAELEALNRGPRQKTGTNKSRYGTMQKEIKEINQKKKIGNLLTDSRKVRVTQLIRSGKRN